VASIDPTDLESQPSHERLRAALVASEERYRRLFEESPQPYLVESPRGVVLDANRAAQRLLGGTREELVGLGVRRITEMDDAEAARRTAVIAREGRATFVGTGIRLDGSRFPESAEVAAVEIDGEPRLLVLLRDLTESKRLEEELVRAQKMEAIGMLVAGVAHELNNPLSAIVAFSDLIRRDMRLPEDLRSDAEMLVAEAARTRRIVSNLLDFARQRPPERHPTSLRALIGTVVDLQSYSLKDGRIAIEVDLPDDLPPVELDRSQLQQVLVNLTLNAVQALRADSGTGRVIIRGRLVPGSNPPLVRIEVEDDGPGVPPADRDRLFLPFFTTKAQGEGTGLGLPVSYGIVAGHGGHLWHEEPEGGRGARFVVEMPVRAGTREPGEAPDLVSPDAVHAPGGDPGAGADDPAMGGEDRHHRVLVLDDEPAIRAFLVKALRAQGIEPVPAQSGPEALDLARGTRFDAILCDHRMAGMTGPAVFEALERDDPALARRFVFMTGDVLNPELRTFAAQRGIALLAKPFDLATVAETVREVLARR